MYTGVDMRTKITNPTENPSVRLPKFLATVAAGFPSPADDYLDGKLDLTELLITHPSATYIAEVSGDSMIEAGIHSGDLLIVNRAQEVFQDAIIIAVINGELTCKIYDPRNKQLAPANKTMKPIPIPEDTDVICEGVVMHVIKRNITAHVCPG